jgi:hypothetical protein
VLLGCCLFFKAIDLIPLLKHFQVRLWAGRAGRFLTSGARLAHRVATAASERMFRAHDRGSPAGGRITEVGRQALEEHR